MKYIATFRRINPQLSTGGYETTVDIEAKNLKQAEREANKISDGCIYGAMVLLNIVPDLPILKTCSDYKRIRDALTVSALRKIERILTAFSKRRIDFAEPTDESGNYIFCGEAEVVILDKRYKPTGCELIVMQWLEGHEDTDQLIEVFAEY